MEYLMELAKRDVADSREQLRAALDSILDSDEIRWKYFHYIFDNDFVIYYVNDPQPKYNIEEAISYIGKSIPNDFSISDYLKLNEKAKKELLKYYVKQLKDLIKEFCDFESYIQKHHLCKFDDVIKDGSISGYIEFLKVTKDTSRLMTIDSQIDRLKNELNMSFLHWLYGEKYSSVLSTNTTTKSKGNISSTLIHYDYDDSELLKKLKGILKKYKLSFKEMPKVYISFEIPTSFKLVETNDEGDGKTLFDTENLLGIYDPSKQEIHLYYFGIQWCANQLIIDADLLYEIVFIHELGHYMQHKMPCYKTEEWEDELYIKSYSPIDIQEGWAQLMDAWTVEGLQDYSDVFQKLVDVQSGPYHVFKKYVKYEKRSILKSLDGLRSLGTPAKIDDWDKLL